MPEVLIAEALRRLAAIDCKKQGNKDRRCAGVAGVGSFFSSSNTSLHLERPSGLVSDAGNLEFVESRQLALRHISAAGELGASRSTGGESSCGNFCQGIQHGGDASGASYVSDALHHVIRKIDAEGRASLLTGTPEPDVEGAGHRPSHAPAFVRRMVSTLAGRRGKIGVVPGALPATLHEPAGIAVGAQGELYITDTYENVVLKVTRP